ncbi:MAG: hypothetical protein JO261_06950 [Alphaproteobacteria bacterium]|nr:hypothetical protein [Alphaproteobacteria bacterium]MBV9693419.1 hypothetical protein [Alphaproteobacteria bacterium]
MHRTVFITVLLALSLAASPGEAKSLSLSFNGTCNVATLQTNAGEAGIWSYVESTSNGSCENWIGGGGMLAGKIDGFKGKWVQIGLQGPSYPGEQDILFFEYPFVTGGKWILYATTDGKTVNFLNGGFYTVAAPSGDSAASRGASPDRNRLR